MFSIDFDGQNRKLMNFMKNCEARVCNGFFVKRLFMEADFMNMREGQTSQLFINPFSLRALSPSRKSADLGEWNWRLR